MQAVILAGGLGLRLREAVPYVPKPLAPIAGRPFLEYLLLQLSKSGIYDVILSLGYGAKFIKEYLNNITHLEINITYSEETSPLGTGGAIRLASQYINEDDFVVLNGDSFLAIDIRELIKFHFKKKSLCTLALTKNEKHDRYGAVEIDDSYRIIQFKEKESSPTKLVNAGIYVLNKKCLTYFPEGQSSFESDVIPNIVGGSIYGIPYTTFFIDIGVPTDYLWLAENSFHLIGFVTH